MPPAVVVAPGLGTGVPPELPVGTESVVRGVVASEEVFGGGMGDFVDSFVIALCLAPSLHKMIRPTASPITSATRKPTIQRVRVSTA